MSIRTHAPIGRIPMFDEGRERRAQRSRGALLIASFGAFLAFLDATIVNVCFPAIEHTFHGSSTSALAWVLNAYNLVFAAMLVAGGRLADVLGRRRMFMGGVALFTASSVLCATAQSLDTLIFWRVWQALGAALLVPASLGVVIHAATEERRSHAVSLWGATAALAAGLGPPIGGAIVAVSNWRMAFLVNLPLGIAAWWFGSRMIDESRSPGRRRMPDLLGVAILAAALAALSLGIVRGPDWSWLSWQSIACFAVAALLLAWVGVRTTSHPVPVIDPGLLRIRTFAVANVATALAGMGMYAYLLNHILWLTNVWRFSLLQAGLAVAPSALVTAVVASRLGTLAQAKGFRTVAVPGAIVWAIGLWWFVHRVGTTPHYLTQWLPGAILAGIGAGATLPILGSAALAAVPGGRYATASSVVSAVRQLGGVLGVSILVVIVGEASPARPLEAIRMLREGWQLSMWCFVAVAVCALAMAARSDPVEEQSGDPVVPMVERNDIAVANERGVGQLEAFRDIAPDVVDRLAATGVRREVMAGEVLFRTGDPGHSIYVVTAGRLEIVKAGAVIGHAGAGAIVGELSVLAGLPRSAEVRAVRDSVVVEVSGSEVTAALSASPAAALGLAGMLAAQVARMPAPARPSGLPSTIAIIGLGRPAHALADRLARLLGPSKRVAIITEEISPDALIAAETAHDRVFLVGGSDLAQIEFCRRHADLMVLVVDGDPRAPLSAPGCEVLLDGVTSPARVSAWLAATGARRVHQMALGGLESLAARIGGTSLGLALAGGGARAFAHIGVLRELEAAGIAVHRVAGTSVGSYVGALYAAGQTSTEIEALIREEFVYRNPVSDYGLPRYALSRGHRIANAAERVYGDILAEALPRELTVMATDIYSREAVALRHGPLRDITRASAAVPGLLPPVAFEGRMLVDGAVTGNLPAMPLIREGCGPVVALDLAVGGGSGPRAHSEPRMPRLGETMMRTLLFAAAEEDHRAAAASDYVVRMPTRDIGLLEFHQIDASLEAGRAAGRALVERLSNPVPMPRGEEISAER